MGVQLASAFVEKACTTTLTRDQRLIITTTHFRDVWTARLVVMTAQVPGLMMYAGNALRRSKTLTYHVSAEKEPIAPSLMQVAPTVTQDV